MAKKQNRVIPAELDYSMFDDKDFLNFVLQRSEILFDVKRSGVLIRDWSKGNNAPLQTVVTQKGVQLAERTAEVINQEFAALQPVLDKISPKCIADIGCGYAIFDLYAATAYKSQIQLIDLEDNDRRHFGFTTNGSAYSSLAKARLFLKSNGVSVRAIKTFNPEHDDLMSNPVVDLAVSFLACGFHFPVDTYMPFFAERVKPGGHIILDLRRNTFDQQSEKLAELGKITVLKEAKKQFRIMVEKHA